MPNHAMRLHEWGTRVPQRLKPQCWEDVYGTAEAVPLSKTGFFGSYSQFAEFVEDLVCHCGFGCWGDFG
jgi:hypothetical protein